MNYLINYRGELWTHDFQISKWIIFSSRRLDGLYTRFYIAHFNAKGSFDKPFLLPQKNPNENILRMKSFNIPEFIKNKVTITRRQIDQIITD